LAQVLLFALISVVAIAYGFRYIAGDADVARGYEVVAHVEDARGLGPGVRVTYRGADVGEIRGVSLDGPGEGVTLRLRVLDGVEIPADAHARVVTSTALGDRRLDVRPDSHTAPFLGDGDELLIPEGEQPPSLDKLISSIDTSLRAIDPGSLESLGDSAATALEGNGPRRGRGHRPPAGRDPRGHRAPRGRGGRAGTHPPGTGRRRARHDPRARRPGRPRIRLGVGRPRCDGAVRPPRGQPRVPPRAVTGGDAAGPTPARRQPRRRGRAPVQHPRGDAGIPRPRSRLGGRADPGRAGPARTGRHRPGRPRGLPAGGHPGPRLRLPVRAARRARRVPPRDRPAAVLPARGRPGAARFARRTAPGRRGAGERDRARHRDRPAGGRGPRARPDRNRDRRLLGGHDGRTE